jgi:hypothetical protein
MADAVAARKILLCGDVGGSLHALYKRFDTARAQHLLHVPQLRGRPWQRASRGAAALCAAPVRPNHAASRADARAPPRRAR